MTINEYLGLDNFDTDKNGKRWSHRKKYTEVVKALGFENIRALIPFSKDELAAALKEDKHLNTSLPRSFDWDGVAGFRCSSLSGVYQCSFIGSPLTKLYEKVGIKGYDVSDGVCILKQCAHMLVRRKSAD